MSGACFARVLLACSHRRILPSPRRPLRGRLGGWVSLAVGHLLGEAGMTRTADPSTSGEGVDPPFPPLPPLSREWDVDGWPPPAGDSACHPDRLWATDSKHTERGGGGRRGVQEGQKGVGREVDTCHQRPRGLHAPTARVWPPDVPDSAGPRPCAPAIRAPVFRHVLLHLISDARRAAPSGECRAGGGR